MEAKNIDDKETMDKRINIRKFWFVCIDGQIMGSMFDMGDGGKRRLPFPYKALGKNDTREEALLAKASMLKYIEDQQAIPKEKRNRGTKNW